MDKRLDKLEGMIQSLQATGISSGRETPPPKSSTVTCVTKQFQRQFPASQSSGEALGRNPRSTQNRRQFIRPFDADVNEPRRTQTETNRSASGSGFPPGRGNPNQNLVRAGVIPSVPRESLQEFVGFVGSQVATLGSTRRTVSLHPNHGQERLTSVGRVANRGVGHGTIRLVHLLQSPL